MTILSDNVGNPLLRKGGFQTLRQTCLCLNAEGRFRHKHFSLIYILPEWKNFTALRRVPGRQDCLPHVGGVPVLGV